LVGRPNRPGPTLNFTVPSSWVKPPLKETSLANQMYAFAKRHQFSIGLLIIFFSVADLWFVFPYMYAGLAGDWHVNWRFFYFFMPEWEYTVPLLLVMSLSGAFILCAYCIKDIKREKAGNKEYAAIVATALGFTYQVIGAWPLWNQWYPWPWQAEIARYGNLLIFPLFIGSLLNLMVGAASLYLHSKIYHEKHPGLYAE
jgi:hypothetical protein